MDLAYRYLGVRDRTVAEMRRFLEGKRVDPATIETAVDALAEQDYLDDARYAREFAEDRRSLDHWGAERIERRLLSAGVDRDVVAAVLAREDTSDELAAAVALLRRRFPTPPGDNRERNRALGVLLRKGYELELAHDAIRLHGNSRPTTINRQQTTWARKGVKSEQIPQFRTPFPSVRRPPQPFENRSAAAAG